LTRLVSSRMAKFSNLITFFHSLSVSVRGWCFYPPWQMYLDKLIRFISCCDIYQDDECVWAMF
jgi:hypothetical protein